MMQQYKKRFLDEAVKVGALKFGEFTLKSGRISPYFFNAGQFSTGQSISVLADCYVAALQETMPVPDLLFGPAYKGIPLVAATSLVLANQTEKTVPFAFNRKEAKQHGEGGTLVGPPLEGKVIILDDVITAGTAIREVMALLSQYPNCEVAGCLLALDRQEKGQGAISAVGEVENEFNIPVSSVANLQDLIEYVQSEERFKTYLPSISAYRDQYGV